MLAIFNEYLYKTNLISLLRGVGYLKSVQEKVSGNILKIFLSSVCQQNFLQGLPQGWAKICHFAICHFAKTCMKWLRTTQ
jgi:hypothetical protein